MADGRAQRARLRRDATRSAVLAAARRVFRRRGYHRATVADVVREAGVARGTFYLYFDSKEAVLQAAIQGFLVAIRGAVRRIDLSPGAGPPEDQIRANLRRICDVLEDHEDVAAVVFMGPAGMDETSREMVRRFWAEVEAMVCDALAVGQGLGVVRPCNRRQVAVMALGAVRAALGERLLGDTDAGVHAHAPAERFDGAFLEELLTFPLKGLLRHTPGPAGR